MKAGMANDPPAAAADKTGVELTGMVTPATGAGRANNCDHTNVVVKLETVAALRHVPPNEVAVVAMLT